MLLAIVTTTTTAADDGYLKLGCITGRIQAEAERLYSWKPKPSSPVYNNNNSWHVPRWMEY